MFANIKKSQTIVKIVLYALSALAAAAVVVIFAVWAFAQRRAVTHRGKRGACQVHTCGAIDPVSEPEYNMKEIVKQSLLLEDHLAQKRKRCKDCIAKHFMTIIALSEEAVCLAGTKTSKYPLMDSNASYYQTLFDQWLRDKDGDQNQMVVEEQLRERRKQLVAAYILK